MNVNKLDETRVAIGSEDDIRALLYLRKKLIEVIFFHLYCWCGIWEDTLSIDHRSFVIRKVF